MSSNLLEMLPENIFSSLRISGQKYYSFLWVYDVMLLMEIWSCVLMYAYSQDTDYEQLDDTSRRYLFHHRCRSDVSTWTWYLDSLYAYRFTTMSSLHALSLSKLCEAFQVSNHGCLQAYCPEDSTYEPIKASAEQKFCTTKTYVW